MDWFVCIACGLGLLIFIRLFGSWRADTYADTLGTFLRTHGCRLVKVDIPRWYQTGPFPKVAVSEDAPQVEAMGVSLTHVEYRIVTFMDTTGQEKRRWVRLWLSPFGAHEILWEPGTTEIPNQTAGAVR